MFARRRATWILALRAASLALAICVLAAWVLSYPWSSGISLNVRPRNFPGASYSLSMTCRVSLSQQNGRIHLSHIGPLKRLGHLVSPDYRASVFAANVRPNEFHYASTDAGYGWWLAGFDFGAVDHGGFPQRDVAVPHWALCLILLWIARPLLRSHRGGAGFPVETQSLVAEAAGSSDYLHVG